ncbi:DivIVA domain-containing protein [Anaerosporobacter faecicola]|uniref:DivIVA domain-containing protein n=1 Tax=Anaerosporobacter faecicola TaxID=2718714 RepID=UPI001438AAC5|nr:DivIVA domain-containing protein [Anaerosporobacter faecicola]
MLTPIELQSKSFKSGIGYDRKDVDAFMREVLNGYEKLYKENVELKDKIGVLNEGIQYYKTIEKTLQKALVLAEQTAEETKQAALKNAKAIEKEAQGKANLIIADAKRELAHVNQMITGLTQQYESYKVQYKQLAAAQIELLQSPTFELTLMNGETLKTSYTNPVDLNLASEFYPKENPIKAHNEVARNSEEKTDIAKSTMQSEAEKSLVEHTLAEQKETSDKVEKAGELFTQEELETFAKISRYVNTENMEELKADFGVDQGVIMPSLNETTDKQSDAIVETTEQLNIDQRNMDQTSKDQSAIEQTTTDSAFTFVEEGVSTEPIIDKSMEKKSPTLESEFEFIDFEVNLD